MDDEEEQETDEARLPLSKGHLDILKRLAADLRGSLKNREPAFIRSAAPAILALKRLPLTTGAVQVRVGYSTPNRGGNYGWADIGLSESELEASIGEHFYDPSVGGDTESETLFHVSVENHAANGSLERWWEHAQELAAVGWLTVQDDSSWDEIDWLSWDDIDWSVDG